MIIELFILGLIFLTIGLGCIEFTRVVNDKKKRRSHKKRFKRLKHKIWKREFSRNIDDISTFFNSKHIDQTVVVKGYFSNIDDERVVANVLREI